MIATMMENRRGVYNFAGGFNAAQKRTGQASPSVLGGCANNRIC